MQDLRTGFRFFSAVLYAAVLVASIPAQVTKATVDIGGPGTQGSEGGDPPVLTDGVVASGQIEYCYDSSTGTLDVTVSNTTPQDPGVNNPVITEVYFNLPYLAVTGATYLGQTGGSGILFVAVIDGDTFAMPNPNIAPGFGSFSVKMNLLMGAVGGITNPAADTWLLDPSDLNTGPVTFSFQLSGPNLDTITADTIASVPSVPPPPGNTATAVFKFQSSGDSGDPGSAAIGTSDGCVPGLWYAGEPCIGQTINVLASGTPGCHGCLVLSFDNTPTVISGINVPLSPPYFIAGGTILSSIQDIELMIPNNPTLVDKTVYMVWVTIDPPLDINFSEVVSLTICN